MRNPRRGTLAFFIFIALVVLLLRRSRYLIGLLFEDGGRDSILPSEIPSENTTHPLLIPKIIHQTYKNEELPQHWKEAQDAVKYYHPDYEYMVRLLASWLNRQRRVLTRGLVLDGRKRSRIHHHPLPVFPADLCWLSICHPTCGFFALLSPLPLWRHLHRPRPRHLQVTDAITHSSSCCMPHCTNGNL